MEGVLLIPPDRGTIIGRALWKPRFVVVGSPQRGMSQTNISLSQVLTTSRIKDARPQSTKFRPKSASAPVPSPDAVYLSIYKSKDDLEAVQQHSMASITSCSVQLIAHRKQGPVLPTLMIQISPDPTTDKLRKRRSSRTAGLTTTKESGPTTLWFRPGDEQYTLHDWARHISSLAQPGVPDMVPMSPITPVSPTFINPFASRPPRETMENSPRPSSGRRENMRPPISHKQSNNSYSSRDRAVTFSSGTPSLRSRTSDLSSHTSSTNPVAKGYVVHGQHYTTVLPSDLPSPASTIGEYQGEYMLGWTAAQGRSSALSSPIRGSLSSQGQQTGIESSSPPAPRETILDRAFQMRCIPGSDREAIPGEENLSSIARFEALMRETEVRRNPERHDTALMSPMSSTWEEDEDSDEEDDLNDAADEDEDSTDDDVFEGDISGQKTEIGPSAQRALHYITNRHSVIAPGSRNSMGFHNESRTLEAGSSVLRPHTAHSKMRPALSTRNSDQTQYPLSSLEITRTSSGRSIDDTASTPRHRESNSSVQRLSFNDFSKRLSSTSSLLLVQTNVSTGSSRGSGEFEAAQQTTPRTGLNPRSPPRPPREQDPDRCGWRGSVGVFGANEGGFL